MSAASEDFPENLPLTIVMVGVFIGLCIIGGCSYLEISSMKNQRKKDRECVQKCLPNYGGRHYDSCLCDLTKVIK